eukprot:GHVS01039954.1.p1 GENE.GHVS01039954.1~~GHVS01039954.1.p1  ORF type:complete len:112 (+),score=13.63 GHVS01039954.1:46-381(+)
MVLKAATVWSGSVHFRVGSRTQANKINRGYCPTLFAHFGQALEFCRTSKRYRPETISEYLGRGKWGKSLACYSLAMEKGYIFPSAEELQKLERLFGVPLVKPKIKQRIRLL